MLNGCATCNTTARDPIGVQVAATDFLINTSKHDAVQTQILTKGSLFINITVMPYTSDLVGMDEACALFNNTTDYPEYMEENGCAFGFFACCDINQTLLDEYALACDILPCVTNPPIAEVHTVAKCLAMVTLLLFAYHTLLDIFGYNYSRRDSAWRWFSPAPCRGVAPYNQDDDGGGGGAFFSGAPFYKPKFSYTQI